MMHFLANALQLQPQRSLIVVGGPAYSNLLGVLIGLIGGWGGMYSLYSSVHTASAQLTAKFNARARAIGAALMLRSAQKCPQ